jgi:hypothetical protein
MNSQVIVSDENRMRAIDKAKLYWELLRGQHHKRFPYTVQDGEIVAHRMVQEPMPGKKRTVRLQGVPLPGQD